MELLSKIFHWSLNTPLKIQYTATAPEGSMIEDCLFYKRGYEIMIGWFTFCELIDLNVGQC